MTDIDEAMIEACAHAGHEAYRAYSIATGDSMPSWDAYKRTVGGNNIRLAAKEILEGKTPERFHAEWSKKLLEDGWKVGPARDPEKKEHPHLVAYDDLPLFQRRRDEIFLTTVRAVAKAIGPEMSVEDVANRAKDAAAAMPRGKSEWIAAFSLYVRDVVERETSPFTKVAGFVAGMVMSDEEWALFPEQWERLSAKTRAAVVSNFNLAIDSIKKDEP